MPLFLCWPLSPHVSRVDLLRGVGAIAIETRPSIGLERRYFPCKYDQENADSEEGRSGKRHSTILTRQFRNRPNVIGDVRLHCGSNLERPVDSAEGVIGSAIAYHRFSHSDRDVNRLRSGVVKKHLLSPGTSRAWRDVICVRRGRLVETAALSADAYAN